jgi:hypothetical protein
MADAQLLKVTGTNMIDRGVGEVADIVLIVDDRVACVDDRAKDVDNGVTAVDDKIAGGAEYIFYPPS